jgi:hypothetical protein
MGVLHEGRCWECGGCSAGCVHEAVASQPRMEKVDLLVAANMTAAQQTLRSAAACCPTRVQVRQQQLHAFVGGSMSGPFAGAAGCRRSETACLQCGTWAAIHGAYCNTYVGLRMPAPLWK